MARAKNGLLFLYSDKPERTEDHFELRGPNRNLRFMRIPNEFFHAITFENSPQQVELKPVEGNNLEFTDKEIE